MNNSYQTKCRNIDQSFEKKFKCEQCKENFEKCYLLFYCGHRLCQLCKMDSNCAVCGDEIKFQIEDTKYVEVLELNTKANEYINNLKTRSENDLTKLENGLKGFLQKKISKDKTLLEINSEYSNQFERQSEESKNDYMKRVNEQIEQAGSNEEKISEINKTKEETLKKIETNYRNVLDNSCKKYDTYLKSTQTIVTCQVQIDVKFVNANRNIASVKGLTINLNDTFSQFLTNLQSKLKKKLKIGPNLYIFCFGPASENSDIEHTYEKLIYASVLLGDVAIIDKDKTEPLIPSYSLIDKSEIVFYGDVELS